MNEISVLTEETLTELSSLFHHVRIQRELGSLQPRWVLSQETDLTGTLILDFQSTELWEITFKVYLFILKEGAEHVSRGGAERGKESQIGFRLSVQSPIRGQFHIPEIVTRAEIKSWMPIRLNHSGTPRNKFLLFISHLISGNLL